MNRMRLPFATIFVAGIAAPLSMHCSSSPSDDNNVEATASRLEATDTELEECRDDAGNLFGMMPKDDTLTDAQKRGRCTWVLYTGGTEDLFRAVTIKTNGKADAIKLVDSRYRDQRWQRYGGLNDPNCVPATEPDEYGFWFDQCEDPFSTGMVGFRKIPNKKFDKSKWNLEAYNADPAAIEPPYIVGTACGSCHVALNPLKPAADPAHPQWDNMLFAFGNQYIDEASYFIGPFEKTDFRWHVLMTQERGTSDTSRQASDHINNPNTINAIINLAHRPTEREEMNDGTFQDVHHILKDGSDSIGVAGASLRVYVNEGMCMDLWVKYHDLLDGETDQKPIPRATLFNECKAYRDTAVRMADMADFLKTQGLLSLANAPNGAKYLTTDEAQLTQGKRVFANNCAGCHSSKQPPAALTGAARKDWFEASVLADDFLDGNFLSDDRRHSIVELGTNASRALATNAGEGHIWADYSSKTFKELPSPGTLSLHNPYDPAHPIKHKVPAGGTGWYRTPSIAAIWATAPYLHNNALGLFNGDPSVDGRIRAFNDGITKLLWPQTRENVIKRTTIPSTLTLPIGQIRVPAGTPVNLLANIDPRPIGNKIGMLSLGIANGAGLAIDDPIVATTILKRFNQSPDLLEDEGHLFGANLSDTDKLALIEFLKTL